MVYRLVFLCLPVVNVEIPPNTCDVAVDCRTQVTGMCDVEFLRSVCRRGIRAHFSGGGVLQLWRPSCPRSTAETAAKNNRQSMAASYPAFSFQLLSMLGRITMGHFPELIDDLIKAVKIYLCIMRSHPSSGQKAQSALSRPGEIQPTDITSVLLLNALFKVIKTVHDKRKICN